MAEVDRPISVLVELDTYQGMTDSEISSLIAYRCATAVQEFANKDGNSTLNEAVLTMLDNNENTNTRLHAMVESVLEQNTHPALEVLTYE